MKNIKGRAAGSDTWCCRAEMQREIPYVFPLHTRIAIVVRSFRLREEPGAFRIREIQPDNFCFLFLTFSFVCIFNISRGKKSTFCVWDERYQGTLQRVVPDWDRQRHCVPLPSTSRPPLRKRQERDGLLHEELLHQPVRSSREGRFSPSESKLPSQAARTLHRGGSNTQPSWVSPYRPALPPKNQSTEEGRPSPLPRLTQQLWDHSTPWKSLSISAQGPNLLYYEYEQTSPRIQVSPPRWHEDSWPTLSEKKKWFTLRGGIGKHLG